MFFMKKIYSLMLALLGTCAAGYANPGDTTWVQANNVQLDWYNNFDTAINFPNGSVSYRKILMVFTLGQYNCPSGSQYCHQWDYDVHNYIMTPAGDTVELSRLITPFANSGWSRFGPTWQQPYVFDVTDFASLLKNTATSRIFYSGYSGGFTANIKYAFIEGTPDRNVTGIDKLYDGEFNYGEAANPINNHLPAITKTAPAGTSAAVVKLLITGHGSDNTNQCCEFDSHKYDLYLNNNVAANKTLWRDNCGLNNLYPQGGTWIYDRANWCPGALVEPIYHKLNGITAGTNFNVQMKFENYTGTPGTNGYGTYKISGSIIYYGGMNKTVDASLEDIIAPTSYPDHFRQNPNSNAPVIRIHNSGSTAISSIQFEYGVKDSVVQQYTWNGTLASLADTTITLPALTALTNLTKAGASGTYVFRTKILSVNGQADNDATNDSLRSNFVVAPLWPGNLVVQLKTGNITNTGDLSSNTTSTWQGNWKITDINGNIVDNNDAKTNSIYNDTIVIPAAGFYKLTLSSVICMGFHWWPYDGANSGVTPGALFVKNMTGANLPMKGYTYAGSNLKDGGQHDDFGCEYTQYFYVASPGTTGIEDFGNAVSLEVFPNPASNVLNVAIKGIDQEANIQLVNILGQTVYSVKTRKQNITISTEQITNGIYTLIYSSGDRKKTEKVVIAK
jgi:hypothetical protein